MSFSARSGNVFGKLKAAMVLQFAVGGAVIPFISVWLKDRGLSNTEVSAVFMSASAALLVVPFFWGMVADRWVPLNRLFGWLNAGVVVALILLFNQKYYTGYLLSYLLFYSCFNPMLLLINPLCFHYLKNPSEEFGLLRAWGSVGWIVPSIPIAAWIIAGDIENLDFALLLGIALAGGMVLMSLWLPPMAPGAAGGFLRGDGAELGYWAAVKRLLSDGVFRTVLTAFFMMTSSFAIFIYYSPALLVELGMSREWIGPVFAMGVLLEIVLFLRRGAVVRCYRDSTLLMVGGAAMVLRQVLYAVSGNLWVLSGSYFLIGFMVVFFHIGMSIVVNAIARREVRATAQALLILCGAGLGPLFGNGAAVVLTYLSGGNLRLVFAFAALASASACTLVYTCRRELDTAIMKGNA